MRQTLRVHFARIAVPVLLVLILASAFFVTLLLSRVVQADAQRADRERRAALASEPCAVALPSRF